MPALLEPTTTRRGGEGMSVDAIVGCSCVWMCSDIVSRVMPLALILLGSPAVVLQSMYRVNFLFLLQLTAIFTTMLVVLQMHQFAFRRWLQVPRHTLMTYLIDIPLLFGVKPTSWSLTEAVQDYYNSLQSQTSFMFTTYRLLFAPFPHLFCLSRRDPLSRRHPPLHSLPH